MNTRFTNKFDAHAYEGDTITTEKDSFIITARIVRDDCAGRPDEVDEGFWPSRNKNDAGYCYPHLFDEQLAHAERIMKAWRNDEWFYCGIVLSVAKPVDIKGRVQHEVVISNHAASLWGLECNYPDSKNEYLTEVANELLSVACDVANECLKQIAA